MQSQGVSAITKTTHPPSTSWANNQEYARNHIGSMIDEHTVCENYLPALKAAVKKAHVGAIMDSYHLTNGFHMTQNGYLNGEVKKKVGPGCESPRRISISPTMA
ncbi:MAG: hypothetical protein DMG70_10740 [Acidobacteria bacterium]|nr:MAG: hypothetical protein DMG70_10740 [Acidobacteriota bacterium]PYY04603.1 MAG: hypothetical protein DMG69_29780 [Acidobacteriota bacterium]